ncbi:MAG: dienelactone hydrolase family protein [Actinomycetes bacterium]|jgi:carboxymethylenebutenolidase
MCFSPDANPPVPVIEGGCARTEDLDLVAPDGNHLAAFAAYAAEPKGPGVVVLPDVRGLHDFYVELAVRFAEHGYDAVAIDYFGRTAGVGRRDATFEWKGHVPKVMPEHTTADVAAALQVLRAENPGRKVFVLGFCFGGSNAWLMAAQGLDLAGAVGFYGNPQRPPLAPIEVVDRISCPILCLQAGDDPGIPLEVVDAYREALQAAGVDHEIVVYDGAPHSFFDRQQEKYAGESADAWRRVMEFFERHG